MEADHRIAVRQNVAKDQPDNPTANRLADQANHTNEETVARIRAHDQDDPNPNPGGHKGPSRRSLATTITTRSPTAKSTRETSSTRRARPLRRARRRSTTCRRRRAPGRRWTRRRLRRALPAAKGRGPAPLCLRRRLRLRRRRAALGPRHPRSWVPIAGRTRSIRPTPAATEEPRRREEAHGEVLRQPGARGLDGPRRLGHARGAEPQLDDGRRRVRRRQREVQGGARRGRRRAKERSPRLVREEQVRPLARGDRELRARGERGEPDVAQRRGVAVCHVPQHDPQPPPPDLRRRVPRLARVAAEDARAQRRSGDGARGRAQPHRRADRQHGRGPRQRRHRLRRGLAELGQPRAALRQGAGHHRLARRQGVPALGVSSRSQRRLHHAQRVPYLLKAAPPGPAPLAPLAPRKGLGAPPTDDTPGRAPAPMLPLRAH